MPAENTISAGIFENSLQNMGYFPVTIDLKLNKNIKYGLV